jgi:hypothetical protein
MGVSPATAGASPTGATGATGAAGPTGPPGPAGKVELVKCKLSGHTTKCTTKLVSGPLRFTITRSAHAIVSHAGVTYARGSAVSLGRRSWALRLHELRRIRSGRYTLTIRERLRGHTIVERTVVRLT